MAGDGADRRADLELALAAVAEAEAPIMAVFRTDPEVRHKGPDQPVTDADLAADRVLKGRLTGERPGYGWLSEESVDRLDRLERDRVWIVDPIDGTRSFIRGYPEFAVSVALAERGKPVIGVVHNPAAEHVVWAVAGAGAWSRRGWTGAAGPLVGVSMGEPGGARRSDAAPLEVGSGVADPGEDPVLLASRSERRAGEFEPFRDGWSVREVGSTAWKLASVAMGRGAYLSRGPKSEWDVAAGALIVAEAGGVVTDLRGHAIGLNRREPYVHGVVAGDREAHARLLDRARGLASPRLRSETRNEDEEG